MILQYKYIESYDDSKTGWYIIYRGLLCSPDFLSQGIGNIKPEDIKVICLSHNAKYTPSGFLIFDNQEDIESALTTLKLIFNIQIEKVN